MNFQEIDKLLRDMEDLQAEKVIALARRLKPGLTLEDIKNPHDFPELDDKDWHYADGVLTGIQSVASAIRAALLESPPTRRMSDVERESVTQPELPDPDDSKTG